MEPVHGAGKIPISAQSGSGLKRGEPWCWAIRQFPSRLTRTQVMRQISVVPRGIGSGAFHQRPARSTFGCGLGRPEEPLIKVLPFSCLSFATGIWFIVQRTLNIHVEFICGALRLAQTNYLGEIFLK